MSSNLRSLLSEHGEKIAGDYLYESLDDCLRLSIAISLRRIADCMDGTAAGVDISESMSRAFRREGI